jgi:hypothetical protein
MPRPNPVVTTATLIRPTGPRTWLAALPNGKEVIAHVPARKVGAMPPLTEGCKVRVELTQFDFSTARIAGIVA